MLFIDFVLRFVSENPISTIGIILGILYVIFSLHTIGPTEIGCLPVLRWLRKSPGNGVTGRRGEGLQENVARAKGSVLKTAGQACGGRMCTVRFGLHQQTDFYNEQSAPGSTQPDEI
jgi:hypothetical protein